MAGSHTKPLTLKREDGIDVKIKGSVLVRGTGELGAAVPAGLVVEKYDAAEFVKGRGKRKPFQVSIDNER